MAIKYADRVAESTVTVGTGDVFLAGPIDADHDSFANQFADTETMPVVVFGGGKWMTFEGRYNSGANSITRINFRDSSTGAPISLSGTMTVMCAWGAVDASAVIRSDVAQALNAALQAQARSNIGAAAELPTGEWVYSTSGSATFTTPADSSSATVYEYEMVSGGGGGGAADGTTASAGGGGAGAEAGGTFTGVAASTAISLSVGTAGSGAAPGAGQGTSGGTTSIGSPVSVSCSGGTGGVSSASGAGASGNGGTVTGSPTRYSRNGQRGFPGITGSSVTFGGGGDGANSSKGNGGVGGRAGISANALAAATGYGAGGGGAFYQTATGSAGSIGYIRIRRIYK